MNSNTAIIFRRVHAKHVITNATVILFISTRVLFALGFSNL